MLASRGVLSSLLNEVDHQCEAGVSKQFEDFDVSSFGESVDKQRATLAYDVGCGSLSSTMLGEAIGTACTFSSGFLVFQSARTGHLVL